MLRSNEAHNLYKGERAGGSGRAGASRNLASRPWDGGQQVWVGVGVRGRSQGQNWDQGGRRLGRVMQHRRGTATGLNFKPSAWGKEEILAYNFKTTVIIKRADQELTMGAPSQTSIWPTCLLARQCTPGLQKS